MARLIHAYDSTRTHFWLRSKAAWLSYGGAWLCFAAAFATLNLFSEEPSLARAVESSAVVIGPAALAGVGVVWLCGFLPASLRPRWTFLLAHACFAVLFPVVWIALVAGPRWVTASVAAGRIRLILPPEHVAHWHLVTGVLIYATLTVITYAIDHARRAETRRREAELALVRARLSPHFLFNTLHSLLELVRTEGASAAVALERFAELLRYSLMPERAFDVVPLAEEWAFTRDYLELERLRLGDRLGLELDIDDEALDCLVPAFVLQPLVENAVRCAVMPRARGGTIVIKARCIEEELVLEVQDDGTGGVETPGSFGLGLQAARERIASRYGPRARFEAQSSSDGFLVSIHLPATSAARV